MGTTTAPQATEQVLSTLNRDGSRRWLHPRLSRGRFHRRRLAVAWGLIALFTAIPYLRMNGKPWILLDVPARRFTLFGATFLPTDGFLLMLLMVGILLTVFLLTAMFGRVWCGWACPQTVYMEFVYRPIERLTTGRSRFTRRLGLDRVGEGPRRALRYALYLLLSVYLAHTFLAYFVGVDRLRHWIGGSPFQHPAAFLVMAVTTLLMLLDFGYFREQVCLVACPYGRFQSVLLDRRSKIVGYDPGRGEPRAKPKERAAARPAGDCIDCGACVHTCPTGIDIREGLQMECVHCTQCIDACDAIMDRVGKPRGLIRYTSKAELAGEPRRMLRPRVVIYPAIIAIVFGLLAASLVEKEDADVTVLRGIGSPYAELPDGRISNQLRIKIVNRADAARSFTVSVPDEPALGIVAPENPLPLAAGESQTAPVFVQAPRSVFVDGRHDIVVRITDGAAFDERVPYRLLGPFGPAPAGDEPSEHRDREE